MADNNNNEHVINVAHYLCQLLLRQQQQICNELILSGSQVESVTTQEIDVFNRGSKEQQICL